jgi:hypothetical protein
VRRFCRQSGGDFPKKKDSSFSEEKEAKRLLILRLAEPRAAKARDWIQHQA